MSQLDKSLLTRYSFHHICCITRFVDYVGLNDNTTRMKIPTTLNAWENILICRWTITVRKPCWNTQDELLKISTHKTNTISANNLLSLWRISVMWYRCSSVWRASVRIHWRFLRITFIAIVNMLRWRSTTSHRRRTFYVTSRTTWQ